MPASPASSPINGHASSASDGPITNGVAGHLSESDLSDIEPPYANAASRSPSPAPDVDDDDIGEEEDEDLAVTNDYEDDPSESSGNDALDDADFNDAQSDAVDAAVDQDEESLDSSDSGRAPKRKASEMAGDRYMQSNPELYGLRRSVSTSGLPILELDRLLPQVIYQASLICRYKVTARSAAKSCELI